MAYNSTHTGQQIDNFSDRISDLETSDSTNTNEITNIKNQLTTIISDITNMWQTIYPVGSIYVSTNSTNPETLFGGTWARIQDTFLLMAGSTYAAGTTGGSATMSHTHSQVAVTTGASSAANTGGTAITTDQMPSHTHTFTGSSSTTTSTSKTLTGSFLNTQNIALNTATAHLVADTAGICSALTYNLNQVKVSGSGVSVSAYSHMVGISINATHTHNLTAAGSNGSAGGGSAHTHSMAHTHSIAATTTGGASNTNNMPPYLAVYCWKRTA